MVPPRIPSFRRTLTAFLLVVLQLHLFGVAALHRHGDSMAPRHGLRASAAATPFNSGADSQLLCTACQIVHHGAVQLTSAVQVLPSAASVPLARNTTPTNYLSELPAAHHGRAPPLA